jgi:hypothetical protein
MRILQTMTTYPVSFEYRHLAPTDLRDFAKSQGWHLLQEAVADGLYVLHHPAFERRQLVFPVLTDAPDYADAVALAVRKLAELMGRPEAAVLAAVQEFKDDTLRFRVADTRHESGYIPLSYAVSAINGAKELFLSAASTVLVPQLHHPRLSRAEALQLLDASRFRHTESGSFVLKVSSPVQGVDAIGGMFDESVPFVRQTTLTINRALHQLVHAVQADTLDQLVEELKQAEKPEISSNLCKAIVSFQEQHDDFDLSVDFNWAACLPLPPALKVPATIKVQKDYFSRIDEVRRELRNTEQQHKQEGVFMASVEHLSGEIGPDGLRSGEVVLNLYQEAEVIKARITLNAEQYRQADRAHMTPGAYLRLKGRLHPGNQPRILAELSGFELILP